MKIGDVLGFSAFYEGHFTALQSWDDTKKRRLSDGRRCQRSDA